MPERITEFQRGSYVFDVIDSGPVSATEPGPDTGSPVVLLHGFPERADCWDAVTPLLNARGLRTVAPDQRGYSPGARPSKVRDYRISELAADVIALVDALGAEKVHLVGHDWGAAVAWAVAATYPDRIRSLTTLAVPHPGAYVRALPKGQLLRSWYMAVFQIPKLPELALATLSQSSRAPEFGPKGFLEKLRTDIIDYGALTGGINWYRALTFGNPSVLNRKITVPTTYLWSDGDIYLARAGARGCAAMVDAPYDFIVLSGVDHWLPQRRPEAIADAITARVAHS
ncbi:MAG: alpha/beta fold hydrolase [Gordonia sp. (in: high G+C Gram-positive bacteria)]